MKAIFTRVCLLISKMGHLCKKPAGKDPVVFYSKGVESTEIITVTLIQNLFYETIASDDLHRLVIICL